MSQEKGKKRAMILLLTSVAVVVLLLGIYAASYLALRKNQAIVRTTFVVPDPPDKKAGPVERVIVVDHFVSVPDRTVGDLDNYRRQNRHFPTPRDPVSGLYAPLTWLELQYWNSRMPIGTRMSWPDKSLYYLSPAKQKTKFGGIWDPARDQ